MGTACWLFGCALLMTSAPVSATASEVCDTERVGTLVQQTLPLYSVMSVRSADGIVTLLLTRRDGVGTFAVALRASGSKLFTVVMSAQLDEAERARASAVVASWYENHEVRQALARCNEGGAAVGDSEEPLRRAVEAALSGHDRLVDRESVQPQKVIESRIVIAALLLSLALVLVPGTARPRPSTARRATPALDRMLVLAAAGVAVAIASAIAWRLGPQGDEVVTLGTRHGAFSYLLSWADGGEPFNPPGAPAIFALWLRIAGGFFWARVLSIALIPLTAWWAYRAGTSAAGRHVGLSFAALVILAPGYLRLAALARGYALLVFALCLLLAAVTRTKDGPSRGRWVGVASLLALWVSYLLWPLALAAPWIARLERRDRLRLGAALGLMAAALAPRVVNGFTSAMGKTDITMFELHGPADALGYALALAGQAAPTNDGGDSLWLAPAGAIAAVLIVIAVVRLRRSAPRQLRDPTLILALLIVPVLALLAGGHGIRDRHVIGAQVGLALFAATGLGLMISSSGSGTRVLGWLLAGALTVICVFGNGAVVRSSDGWIAHIAEMGARADLLMIVPRSAQFPVYAMLTGDVPLGSETARWPPVCASDTEWWCRRVGRLSTVSVDEVTDGVVASAAAFPRSIWIIDARGGHRIPAQLRACEQVQRDASWAVLECSNASLRAD